MPKLAKKRMPAWLPMLPLLLTACATTSPPLVVDCPQPPPRPAVRQPAPPLSYSERAQTNIETWQQRLMDTLPTSKP